MLPQEGLSPVLYILKQKRRMTEMHLHDGIFCQRSCLYNGLDGSLCPGAPCVGVHAVPEDFLEDRVNGEHGEIRFSVYFVFDEGMFEQDSDGLIENQGVGSDWLQIWAKQRRSAGKQVIGDGMRSQKSARVEQLKSCRISCRTISLARLQAKATGSR